MLSAFSQWRVRMYVNKGGGGGGAPFSHKMGGPCPPPGDTHVYLCSTSQLYVHCLSYTHTSVMNRGNPLGILTWYLVWCAFTGSPLPSLQAHHCIYQLTLQATRDIYVAPPPPPLPPPSRCSPITWCSFDIA